MPRRTKIVATIGPASSSPAVVRGLLEAGMDVARLGLAHGPLEHSIERIETLRSISRELRRPIGTSTGRKAA